MSTVAELLADLARAPQLSGARCRDEWELFDATAAGRSLPRTQVIRAQHDAIELCAKCPVLAECRDYINAMPSWTRPRGVVAGQLDVWREPTLSASPRPMRHDPLQTRTIGAMHSDNELGAVLRSLREQHRWRQRDLAALIGTQQNRVGDWESGHHVPTLAALQRLAAAFDLTVSELLDGVM